MSSLPHLVEQSKSQGQTRVKGKENRLHLLLREQNVCTDKGETIGGRTGDSATGVDEEW